MARKRPKANSGTTRPSTSAPSFAAFAAAEDAQRPLADANAKLARQDAALRAARADVALLRKRLVELERECEAMAGVQAKPVDTYVIKPTSGRRVGEAMAWLMSSDTHIEEHVAPEMVNGLNRYDLDISKRRFDQFFIHGYRLIDIIRRDVAIPRIGVVLGGDMITGSIHEDLAENNLLPPVDAALRCAEYVCSGLEFLERETAREGVLIDVHCMTGNHGRTTKERRVATEPGYSIERLLYEVCKGRFTGHDRVNFHIARAYHTYVQVYDTMLRLHHGHAIKYGGGVGGITIPVLKAINQWQTSRHADLDIFGHFHQFIVHKRFISNGSLIGWSPYAISIKAEFERPQQALFVIDKKRGRTWTEPIFVDEGEDK